eukprot:270215-Prymnesium_polylepis.1
MPRPCSSRTVSGAAGKISCSDDRVRPIGSDRMDSVFIALHPLPLVMGRPPCDARADAAALLHSAPSSSLSPCAPRPGPGLTMLHGNTGSPSDELATPKRSSKQRSSIYIHISML